MDLTEVHLHVSGLITEEANLTEEGDVEQNRPTSHAGRHSDHDFHEASKLMDKEGNVKSEIHLLMERRQLYDQLMWQIPALSLTGESFLFIISLGAAVSNIARIISSGLGIVVVMSAMHSLDRLSTFEWYDAAALKLRLDDNRTFKKYPILGAEYRASRAKYCSEFWCNSDLSKVCKCDDGAAACLFYRCTAPRVWLTCFWLMAIANVAILVLSSIQLATGTDRYFK
jgi:hypothetical protein